MKESKIQRLAENAEKHILRERWGSYLSERQWCSVWEDYSEDDDAWKCFLHEHITETCCEVGFESLSYFNELFKKITGENPSIFKKLYLK